MATFDILFTPNVTPFGIAFRAGTVINDISPITAAACSIDPYYYPSPFDYTPLPSPVYFESLDPTIVVLQRTFGPRWQSG